MKVSEYIKLLEAIKKVADLDVRVQTLTHVWEAEKPEVRTDSDGRMYVLLNP